MPCSTNTIPTTRKPNLSIDSFSETRIFLMTRVAFCRIITNRHIIICFPRIICPIEAHLCSRSNIAHCCGRGAGSQKTYGKVVVCCWIFQIGHGQPVVQASANRWNFRPQRQPGYDSTDDQCSVQIFGGVVMGHYMALKNRVVFTSSRIYRIQPQWISPIGWVIAGVCI